MTRIEALEETIDILVSNPGEDFSEIYNILKEMLQELKENK